MKNLIISVLLTKVLADNNVLVPCTASELVGMVIAVFTIVTLIDMQWDKLRQQVKRKKRR